MKKIIFCVIFILIFGNKLLPFTVNLVTPNATNICFPNCYVMSSSNGFSIPIELYLTNIDYSTTFQIRIDALQNGILTNIYDVDHYIENNHNLTFNLPLKNYQGNLKICLNIPTKLVIWLRNKDNDGTDEKSTFIMPYSQYEPLCPNIPNVVTEGSASLLFQNHIIHFTNPPTCSGLSGSYYCDVWKIDKNITVQNGYDVQLFNEYTSGFTASSSNNQSKFAYISNKNGSTWTLSTFIYWVRSNTIGSVNLWWPTDPANVGIAYKLIDIPPAPVITNITSNMIGSQQYGYTLFKGKTGALYSTVQGSPVLYNWYYSVCDSNVWWYWPYNYNNYQIYTQSFPSSPHFLLRNASYSSFSYCPVDYAPTALHLFAKLRVHNNSGENLTRSFRINPTTNLAGGGCPYIFVLGNDTSGGKYFTENNILHRSEFSENANQSITDVYKLNTVPKIDSNKITIQIMETENDVNYFDQIKLFAVDHPAGSKIGITESNDIVMYYSEDVSSSDYATQNFSSFNIAPYIQYGQPTPKITGLSNDFVNSHYDSTSQYSKLKSYKNRLKAKGYKGYSDSLALIGEIGSDVMIPIQPGVKDWAGSISIYTNSDTYIKPFSKRVNVSDVIIPFAQTEDIVDNIDINFNSDYAMLYFSVVPVFYEGFTKTELSLLSAVHAVNGDILSSLSEIDNEFAVMDTTAIIDLKFESIIPPDQSMVRDYVFVVNGLYTSEYSSNKNQPFRLTSNNSVNVENTAFKYRLNTNYPNPFNPKTKISYSLAKSGITKLTVYDVLGRLVNVLVNEYKSAGEYTIEFNGSHLSSGVYIYRLESNDFVDTKRMILIK